MHGVGHVALANGIRFDVDAPLLIIGAGACGLSAALAAADVGTDAIVVERDASPSGSTSLSSGMIPAAGTAAQACANVQDSPALMARDIQAKAKGQAPQSLVDCVARTSGPTIDWLANSHGVELELVEGFLYPGHSVTRMHAPASRTGAELEAQLLKAVAQTNAEIVTNAQVTTLFADPNGRVSGVECTRPNGQSERIGCAHLLLACNGYGGNASMIDEHIPEMNDAQYFGHQGNQGDGAAWGSALGGALRSMSAYQGHGSVATPHQILITWALMMEGGIQVNQAGVRFSNEHDGYSEQAVRVIAQPNGLAWNIYDARLHALGMEFEDYRNACAQGALKTANSIDALAAELNMPAETLATSVALTGSNANCTFGRDFSIKPALQAPFHAIQVTGALFHTQGGLMVDEHARVLRANGQPLPNLYAGGGAACGVSGDEVWGYLSGNGLLTAVTLGRLAGLAPRT